MQLKKDRPPAPLSSYLALFDIAGPRDLAAHVSAIPLSADVFPTWNAVGADLHAVLKRDGERIVCPELGTRYPMADLLRETSS